MAAGEKRRCILCGKSIGGKEACSTYRVAGTIRGFQKNLDMEKAFHNDCLIAEEGINEISRAQVLDYLRAHPKLLLNNPKLLSEIAPDRRFDSDTVVDMQRFVVQRLRRQVELHLQCGFLQCGTRWNFLRANSYNPH